MIRQFTYSTPGQGLHPITDKLDAIVRSSGIEEGLCTVFLQHTSASLIIQENADPSARRDLERWMERMVPEGDPHYTHVSEGPDDMPSHIRSVLTQVSIGIPIVYGALALGQWQGVYVWEHRRSPHKRTIVVHVRED